MLALDKRTIRSHQWIPLAEVDATVAARLGPGRVRGNAQPAAFSRQIAMYLAHQVAGWSTTQVGKFYNGRDHSTVCYAIGRIRALREADADVDELLTALGDEIRNHDRAQSNAKMLPKGVAGAQPGYWWREEGFLNEMAGRIATLVISQLTTREHSVTSLPSHRLIRDRHASIDIRCRP
jgi:hypothetical protein